MRSLGLPNEQGGNVRVAWVMYVDDEMRNEAIEVRKVLNTPPMCTGEQLFSRQCLQTTSFQQFKYNAAAAPAVNYFVDYKQ